MYWCNAIIICTSVIHCNIWSHQIYWSSWKWRSLYTEHNGDNSYCQVMRTLAKYGDDTCMYNIWIYRYNYIWFNKLSFALTEKENIVMVRTCRKRLTKLSSWEIRAHKWDVLYKNHMYDNGKLHLTWKRATDCRMCH